MIKFLTRDTSGMKIVLIIVRINHVRDQRMKAVKCPHLPSRRSRALKWTVEKLVG